MVNGYPSTLGLLKFNIDVIKKNFKKFNIDGATRGKVDSTGRRLFI